MSIRPDTDDLIAFLNELARLDPAAMRRLVAMKAPCNQVLAAHPTVQVGARRLCQQAGCSDNVVDIARRFSADIGSQSDYEVGLLGILNGYAGSIDEGPQAGWGPIAAVMDEDRIWFCRTERLDR